MPDFNEMTIQVTGGRVKGVTRTGAGTDFHDIELDQLRLATIKVFEELLLRNQLQTRRHMEVLGQHLYEALFPEPVDKLLNETIKAKNTNRLRLQLHFERDVEDQIANLPWEFLYSPSQGDFLATDVNLVLSRYMTLGVDREVLSKTKGPLRVLMVISRTDDEPTLMTHTVIEKIEGINRENQPKRVDIKKLEKPTLEAIEEALREHQPHVFHFIGHGRYDSHKKTGYLSLVHPETNKSEPCDDSTLIEQFKSSQCFPRLVFLHMCEGAALEKDASSLQAFGGFAPKLIHARIPSVVAMQYPILNEDAQNFAVTFYECLSNGGSADEAVQEGRRKLDRNRRTRLFGTPVLFMHSADGLVIPGESRSQGKDQGTQSPKQQEEIPGLIPGGPEAPKIRPIDAQKLDVIFATGIQAAQQIPEVPRQAPLIDRILRLKNEAGQEPLGGVFQIVYRVWNEEEDPGSKKVWEALMTKTTSYLTESAG